MICIMIYSHLVWLKSVVWICPRNVTALSNAMFSSAKEAGCVPKKQFFRPKRYWCPELSKLRDAKRFWWGLWVDNGRRRSGEVFKCWKGVKKLFRKLCRQRIDKVNTDFYTVLNDMYDRKNMSSFWRKMKQKRRKSSHNASMEADKLTAYYSSVMQDRDPLNLDQEAIKINVLDTYRAVSMQNIDYNICPDKIHESISSLKRNSSPGLDGVSSEYFILGNSTQLCHCLSSLYSEMLRSNCVPSCFKTGRIIPILTKTPLIPINRNTTDPSHSALFFPSCLRATCCLQMCIMIISLGSERAVVHHML